MAKYFSRSDRFADLIAPFPNELTLDREYDLLFAVLDNPWQMHFSRNNIANSLLKNDWVYRWRDIAVFNLEPTSAMLERETHLKQLAKSI